MESVPQVERGNEEQTRNSDLLEYGECFEKAQPLTYEQVYDEVKNYGKGEYSLKTEEFCKMMMKENKRDLVITLSKEPKLSMLEVVSFCNLEPTTIDQAKIYVPSVTKKEINEIELKKIVSHIESAADEDHDDSFDW